MMRDRGQPTQTFASIGIHIGKDVFHVVGFDTSGKVVLRKKFKRLALKAETRQAATEHRRSRGVSQRALSSAARGAAREPIQRPNTYQRLPKPCAELTCDQQPVHTFGS